MNDNLQNVSFGFAVEKDFDQVINLLEEITEVIKSKDGWSEYTVNHDRKAQRALYLSTIKSGNKIFVAKIQEEIVGLINMQLVENIRHGWKRAHLEEVVVKEGFRHRGIGSQLMHAVKDYCTKNEIKAIKLLCGNQLTDSHKFYEKIGFVCKDKGYRLENL